MVLRLTFWYLLGTPVPVNTSGTLGSAQLQLVSLLTVKQDLSVVGDLLHVRPVVVEAHVAHKEYLAVGEVAGEAAVFLLAARGAARPVAVYAGGRVVPLQREAVLALVEGGGAVTGVGDDHHPVCGRNRHRLAPGGHTAGRQAPAPVVALQPLALPRQLVVVGAVDGEKLPVTEDVPQPGLGVAMLHPGHHTRGQTGGGGRAPLPVRPTRRLL